MPAGPTRPARSVTSSAVVIGALFGLLCGWMLGAQQAEWYDKLEEEHDNLRSALWWLLDRDAASALQLAVVVRRLWTRHGHLTEGRGWLEAALAKSDGAEAQLRTKALIGAGEMLRGQQLDIESPNFIPEGAAQIHYMTPEQVEREQAILARAPRPGHPIQLQGSVL